MPTQRKRLQVYSQTDLAQFPPLHSLVAVKVTVYPSFNLFVSRLRLILALALPLTSTIIQRN